MTPHQLTGLIVVALLLWLLLTLFRAKGYIG